MRCLALLLVALCLAFALPQYPNQAESCVTCKWLVAYTQAYSVSEDEAATAESLEVLCDELDNALKYQCHHFVKAHLHEVFKDVKAKKSQDEICGIHNLHMCLPNARRWSSYNNPYVSVSEDKPVPDAAKVDGLTGKLDRVELELVVDHGSVGDLTITLEHSGKKVTLVHKPDCSPSGFYWITLSDNAEKNIQDVCSNEIFRDLGTKRSHHLERKPIQGIYQPKESMDAFKGLDPNGDWVLSIFDNVKNEFQGTLNYWKMHLYGVTPKDSQEMSVQHTKAVGEGLTRATVGQQAEFTIIPKDKWDNNASISEPNFKFEMSCGIPKEAEHQGAQAAECSAGGKVYDCSDNVKLISHLTHQQMGGTRGNDIWGWTDRNGREWAIVCQTSGTAFVDITDPTNPIYTAYIDTATTSVTWRDAKVYKDHVFIIAESTRHGMQVFDLHRLSTITNPPQKLEPDVHYTRDLTNSHNIYINEDTGYAYIVGATGASCGGIYIVDINDPKDPKYVTCHSPRYTHDIECMVYNGPDKRYTGREICFCFDAGYGMTIKDVTDKQDIKTIGVIRYGGVSYCHQGWVTTDRETVFMNDELGATGRTYTFDVSDLEDPKGKPGQPQFYYHANARSSQHNNYILGGHVFQSNYQAGVRILDVSDPRPNEMFEAGYLDTAPGFNGNSSGFNGQWSLYPYFASGNIISNDIQNGLFVFQFDPSKFHIKTSSDEMTFCEHSGESEATITVLSFDKDGNKQSRNDIDFQVRGLPSSAFSYTIKKTGSNYKLVVTAKDAFEGNYPFELVGTNANGDTVVRKMIANVHSGTPSASFSTKLQKDGSVKVTYTVDKAGSFPLKIYYGDKLVTSDTPHVITVKSHRIGGVMTKTSFNGAVVIVVAVVMVTSLLGLIGCVIAKRSKRRQVARH